MFIEENLPLSKLLNLSLPQFPSCISIYDIVYMYKVYIIYMCTATCGMAMFESHVFIFLYLFNWVNEDLHYKNVKGFASQKISERLNKARPPESSWPYFSHTIILPPKWTFSLLTIDKTHGSSPNMPFPHMVTQDWQFDSSRWKSWYKYLFMTPMYCGKHPFIGRKDTLLKLMACQNYPGSCKPKCKVFLPAFLVVVKWDALSNQ